MNHRTAESHNEYVRKRNLVNTMRRIAKSECWEKLGKELQEDANGSKKKLLFSPACSYRKGEENAAITVNDEDGNE